MDRITDDRVAFYLENRDLIEQWARLRSEAVEAAHTFFCSCALDLAELGESLEPAAKLCVVTEGSQWSRLLLMRPEWPASHDCGYTLAGIGIEWRRRKSQFAGGSRLSAGLRVDLKKPPGDELTKTLASRLAVYAQTHGFQTYGYWPYQGRLTPEYDDYWNDLAPFRGIIVDTVRTMWEDTIDIVDEAVQEALRA